MIRAKRLLSEMDNLTFQVIDQGFRIAELEEKIKKLEQKEEKAPQPRDKSGKFTKKK